MAPISTSTSQRWRFIPLGGNAYGLRNRLLNNTYSLDIINDGVNTKPYMALTGPYAGQFWNLFPQGNGGFKLNNYFSNAAMYLKVDPNNSFPIMDGDNTDHTGQLWNFVAIERA